MGDFIEKIAPATKTAYPALAVGRAVVATVRWGRKAPPGCILLGEGDWRVLALHR